MPVSSKGVAAMEDDLAYLREQGEFLNLLLAEQPNGDFAETLVRQVLLDAFRLELYESLLGSKDARLAQIAAKAVKETRYHLRYSSGWLVRLGDGTEESHRRAQAALERLWRFTAELFSDEMDDAAVATAGVAPRLADLAPRWRAQIEEMLRAAALRQPPDVPHAWHGKRGQHTEHLGYLLAEMQSLHRAHPGATW